MCSSPFFSNTASAAIRETQISCCARSPGDAGASLCSAPSRNQRRSVIGARGRKATPCRAQASWICVCHGLIQAPPNSSSSSLLANGLENPRPPTRSRASSTVRVKPRAASASAAAAPARPAPMMRMSGLDAHDRNPRCQEIDFEIHKLEVTILHSLASRAG